MSQLRLEYDPALPITAHRAEILEALAHHPVIVVCGATGSGKTTQLPKLCLEAGRGLGGRGGLIGHTQPRRIAARALAARLASELGTTVGDAVGYKVRFNERTGPQCRVKLMTDGILLKELESDVSLRRYDTLIIDEAHERSLNIDLLLGVIKRLSPRRPELRVIVTSATIDPDKFSAFFGGAPVIEVSGRSYPVELRYRPLIAEDEDAADLSLPEGIVEAVRELDGKAGASRGDTLVFLPGEKHIREAADELQKAKLHNTEILPLFSRLSTRDQERIFEGHAARRVVLATNVAETSLTVPGIRYVIDSGLARISRYSVRGKVQRLPIERISKASADQRKGRCGREAEGICIRLYSEEDFEQREEFTPPEVLRTNLASVILRMASIGLGEPEEFPFIDPPDTRLVNDGVRLLQELKAMDEGRRVTSLGHKIAALPVDPRLGRMLLAASHHNCVPEMLAITAFLEVQDPRERPTDAPQQADEKHALFADPRSDFVSVLNLWRRFNEQAAAASRNALRKWCREHFLSFVRMREWQELHGQLSEAVRELELRPRPRAGGAAGARGHGVADRGAAGHGAADRGAGGHGVADRGAGGHGVADRGAGGQGAADRGAGGHGAADRGAAGPGAADRGAAGHGAADRAAAGPGAADRGAGAGAADGLVAGYADLHQAILTGFLGSIGSLDEKREYDGPRGTRFVIAPGTPLASRSPKWVVAGSVVETTRVYARMVASVNPQWIESAGAHLLKRTYTEPHWVRARGFVAAFETVTLYGLTLASQRRVNYGAIQPREARDIFIREYLINDEETRDPAVRANRQLREEIEALEAKIRRRDIVVDEQAQVDFYAARLPERVNTVALFERWRIEGGASAGRPSAKGVSAGGASAGGASAKGALVGSASPVGASAAERRDSRVLCMTRADLMRREAPEAGLERYPDDLPVGPNRLPLEYRFEPGEPNDGVTVIVPEPLLEMLNAEQLAWLVPGMRLEKVTEILRGLPKAQRKLLVPVPDHARQALQDADEKDPPGFYTWLSGWVSQRIGAPVTAAELSAIALPDYLRMNVRVLDADDRIIAEGRDVSALRRKVRSVSSTPSGGAIYRQWDFGDLPRSREVDRNRLRLIVYPAIEDREAGVALVEARNAATAEALTRTGLMRLAMLALPQQAKYIHKRFADDRDLVLLSSGIALARPLADALTRRAFLDGFFPTDTPLPRSQSEFATLLESRRAGLSGVADALAATLLSALKELRSARAALAALAPGVFAEAIADITGQLQVLLPPTFIESTPRPWLDYLPRYLKAIARRIERLAGNLKRDAELSAKVRPFSVALKTLTAQPSVTLPRQQLEHLRWMIEEFRVSLFAQELRTMQKVSEKRLAEQVELARKEASG